MQSVVSKLRGEGINIATTNGKFYYRERDVFGFTTLWYEIIKQVTLLGEPCKEFRELSRMVSEYANIRLSAVDLYNVDICGKRGRDYSESGARNYMAFNPQACKKAMLDITSVMEKSGKVKVSIREERDCEDEEYSRSFETESYGTFRRFLSVSAD